MTIARLMEGSWQLSKKKKKIPKGLRTPLVKEKMSVAFET